MSIASGRLLVLAGVFLVLPGLMTSAGLFSADPTTLAVATGLGVMGAVGIMMWAAHRVPGKAAFTIIIIALLLPELSVESYLAWTSAGVEASGQPSPVLASITGSTRLIVGIAWPLVIFGFWFSNRKSPIVLGNKHRIVLPVIFLATLYTFNIYIKGFLSIIDGAILLMIFAVFVVRSSRQNDHSLDDSREDDITASPKAQSHSLTAFGLFILAAASAVLMIGAFSDNLALAGAQRGVDQVILTQWVVPLVSKGPWLVLILAMVLKARASSAASVLLTSHVGLLALSLGLLPLLLYAHGFVQGGEGFLTLDDRQKSELLLTATQSLFAVALLSGVAISWKSGLALGVLFVAHLIFRTVQPEGNLLFVNGLFSAIYLSSAIVLLVGNRARLHVLAGAIAPDISRLRRSSQSSSVGDNPMPTEV